MNEADSLSTFKTINEDIKTILGELEEHIAAHLYFDYSEVSKNNEAFIEMLDKLLEARCTIEELKKCTLSQ